MTQTLFRWGVLSTAKIAREHVLWQLQDADNGVVTAIASRERPRAAALAARFGVPHAFGSYQALLDSDAVDGVYIPLPTSDHVAWAVRAAEAGKHVLVEKPLALSAADIAPVRAAAERAGVLVAEAFMIVHHPQWHKVRELVGGGAIGRLRQVQGAFAYYNRDPDDMRNRPELGGGALPDIGVYPVLATRFATGREPLRVRAGLVRDAAFGTDVEAEVTADFGAFRLSFYVATQLAARQAMVFHGTDGFVEVETPFNAGIYGDDRVVLHDRGHATATAFRFADVRQYRLQAEAFARRARGEDVPVVSLDQSLANQRVIDAIYRAAAHDGWEPV